PREVGTVNLGPEPISFGGDARSCTIYARGAASRAFCFWFRDGTVRCEDVPTGEVREMAPGQALAIGTLNVVVRTTTGPTAEIAVRAPVPPAPRPAPHHGTIKPPPPPARPAAPSPAPVPVRPAVPSAPGPSGEGCPTCGRKAP